MKFDRFGHARDELTVKAKVSDEGEFETSLNWSDKQTILFSSLLAVLPLPGSLSSAALKTLRSLPRDFQRLLKHPPLVPDPANSKEEEEQKIPLPIERLCKATIAGFFGVRPE